MSDELDPARGQAGGQAGGQVGPAPRRPALPVSRIVVLLMLAAVIVVAVFEFRTRRARSESFNHRRRYRGDMGLPSGVAWDKILG